MVEKGRLRLVREARFTTETRRARRSTEKNRGRLPPAPPGPWTASASRFTAPALGKYASLGRIGRIDGTGLRSLVNERGWQGAEAGVGPGFESKGFLDSGPAGLRSE